MWLRKILLTRTLHVKQRLKLPCARIGTMKIGIIIETNEPEKAWNAVRFANTSLKRQHSVKIFLMSAGVEIESIAHSTYNAKEQIDTFVKNGGAVFACGTCIKSRNQSETDVCPISTMDDCLDVVEWADKVVTF
jgi:sulfur relay (sulfurtransferase) complex TusBCD TusD component (DsrE family)